MAYIHPMTIRPAFDRLRHSVALTMCAAVLCAQASSSRVASAQGTAVRGEIPRDAARERMLMQQVTAPDGFRATLFAAPPVAMYPTCLTAALARVVFACVDPNLSLTAAKGKGRVVRLEDTDSDGHADRYSVFATMDSPRGLAFDGQTLYVMHPPTLTAYRDTTGDGIADTSVDLVTGLGFDLDFRGADHTTNGITLGIDGWIYIAVGDYGYRRAVGKDGTTIAHRGGGVVRVRTDGSGLELYASGTRNIYDLAVDPMLHVFTRDNTNDGDGWDIRLHYLPAGAFMGYPTQYKNFSSEHMQSLADYGGGAGTGGLWVHDAGFPGAFGNALYTADWLLNQIFRHPLAPRGASFVAGQEKFLSIPHPADMVMDGQSNMYVASLAGGEYTYQGDSVGFIVRVQPVGGRPSVAADLDTVPTLRLVPLLRTQNAEHRLQAQRELLRRKDALRATASLKAMILGATAPDFARVAAMFTLTQLVGAQSRTVLTAAAVAADAQVRALALRALADKIAAEGGRSLGVMLKGLKDRNAQVQVEAIASLVRLRAVETASSIVLLTASDDPTVSHIATNALVSLNAVAASLKALDDKSPRVRAGALRALSQMHDTAAVHGLMRAGVNDRAAPARDIVLALARLYHTEAPWSGDWWGTRPSYIGPYFAPVTWEASGEIRTALSIALLAATPTELPALAAEFVRNRVLPQGAAPLLAASANNASLRGTVVSALVGYDKLPASAIASAARWDSAGVEAHAAVAQLLAGETAVVDGALPLIRESAADAALAEDVRAKLIGLIGALPGRAGLDAVTPLLARTIPAATPTAGATAGPLEGAWRRFVGDRRRLQELDYFIDLSHAATPDARTLGFAVLLQAVRGNRAPAAITDKVRPVLDAAFRSRASGDDLARAVAVMRLESAYTAQLAARRAASAAPAPSLDWVQLFNGKNLARWTPKFTGQPLGVNLRNTFRVEDGLLKVRYDQWPDFKGEFGHLFYDTPYSYYIIAVEYRFVGEQPPGASGPYSWATRNNGIMVHSQSAASMGLQQDFPISLEVQLLGGTGTGTRTNGNLCTPGTNVVMNDKLVTTHCINANAITYEGDQWVRVEAMVLGDSVIKHIVNGDTVITYHKPQMGGGQANNTNPGVLVAGQLLSSGFITLQAESAPIDFRKVEFVNLAGCMDPKSANYRPYFVKSDPAACGKR